MKHNNVLPNQHFKKHWQFRVKVNFKQPVQAKIRAQKRKEKAKKIAPRPLKNLRPEVQCQTQRYNIKSKLGRGFTPLELKTAGINVLTAPTIGISVDKRRKNRSQEGLDRNVARLKQYLSKLIVFPRHKGKFKKGDSSPDELAAATQVTGTVLPLTKKAPSVTYAKISPEMTKYKPRSDLKMNKAYEYTANKAARARYGKAEEETKAPAPAAADAGDE